MSTTLHTFRLMLFEYQFKLNQALNVARTEHFPLVIIFVLIASECFIEVVFLKIKITTVSVKDLKSDVW